ncbi:MAG: sigma-70 family RNA polymerase sigma factor [Bacteroidota bacterium]
MLSIALNDQELVTHYIHGNESAIEILITRHKRKVFSYIYNLVKDRDVAEDLFQDTFIKVINTLKGKNYNEEGKFLPWVMRIAHNIVIDYFRKAKKMQTTSGGDDWNIFDSLNVFDDTVHDKMEKKQVKADVRRLIEKLPDDQREVLVMRHYEDLSFKEIAEISNISINTALGRMRYALINLRKLIEEYQLVLVD